MIPITHAALLANLHYDENTGAFRWKVKRKSTMPIGSRAGCVKKSQTGGYRLIRIFGILYREHRLAWFYMTGQWPRDQLDHIDGDRANNRFRNLREANNSTNMQNVRQARKDSRTGMLGVLLIRGKFMARIKLNGRQKNCGLYPTPEMAHQAYITAKRTLHHGCTI